MSARRRFGLSMVAALAGALVIRRIRREPIVPEPDVRAEDARRLVEAALGTTPERRRLALDFAPARATSLELLVDGPAFFPRLLADIEAATSDVHMLIFGFKDGEIGREFRDLLVRKVAQGVPVRLLVEAGYSQPAMGEKAFYRTLVEGGVVVTANEGAFLDLDGPLGQRRPDWRFDDLGHFDHRKIVVIDGRVAFVGGPGIEDHYANDQFHDVMVRLEGPVVAQVQAAFLLSWHFQGGPLPDEAGELDRFFPAPAPGDGVDVEVLMNNPAEKWRPIEAAFREAARDAAHRLYVVNPYLADRTILTSIVAAAGRGVDTRVIVPADPRSPLASGAVRHWFGPLLDAGADVREHEQMAHAKVMLSDDTVLVGTANLDGLSLRRNWEMQLRIRDAAFAAVVARDLFDRDLLRSVPGTAPTSLRDRIRNAAFDVISPFL